MQSLLRRYWRADFHVLRGKGTVYSTHRQAQGTVYSTLRQAQGTRFTELVEVNP